MPAACTTTPPRQACVTRDLLEHWAAHSPERVFAVFEDGTQWTYAQTLATVRETAHGLQQLGVQQDDTVLVWLPNGADALRTWFAVNYLGAVYVGINTAYKGGVLEHVVRNAGARLMVSIGPLAERLQQVDLSQLQQLVLLDASNTAHTAMPAMPTVPPGLTVHPRQVLQQGGTPAPLARPIEPWDTQAIVYTSGTTGPSKGVLSSYAHLHTMSVHCAATRQGEPMVGADDRFLLNLPLFHVGGLVVPLLMLPVGGSIAVQTGFDTAGFWPTVQRTGSTITILLGVMASYLVKQTRVEDAAGTPLRHIVGIPFTEEVLQFHQRFGIAFHTLFNMSEVSCPLISDPNPTQLGSCGSPREGMQVRIVDEHDNAVPTGTVGELVVRGDAPWSLNHGYNANPEATASAWRNGWFHTGDAFRRDEAGHWYFVDRIKDAIRRRGENISSFEVESALTLHPAIREAAAVAVPSPESEDEVLAVVSLVEGATLDCAELIEFLRPRMAHFMIPRYVRVLADLPKTPTAKVQKVQLRQQGLTPDTWDREAAGIRVARDKF